MPTITASPFADDARIIDAATARRFLVARHLLAPPRALPAGTDGVETAIRRLGSAQFDPLAVAGRNHDLVLHARVEDYEPAWTDQLLYEHRSLVEIYNKGLSLLPAAELPWYRVSWDNQGAGHRFGAFTKYAETVDHILARIRAEGPLCVDAMRRALAAYVRFAGAREVAWAAHLGRERRLIGSRPRDEWRAMAS